MHTDADTQTQAYRHTDRHIIPFTVTAAKSLANTSFSELSTYQNLSPAAVTSGLSGVGLGEATPTVPRLVGLQESLRFEGMLEGGLSTKQTQETCTSIDTLPRRPLTKTSTRALFDA